MTSKFKVGDIVCIKYNGVTYTTYERMFERMGFANKKRNNELPNGSIVKIFAIGNHETTDEPVYGCVGLEGQEVLMGGRGLKTIEFPRAIRKTTINQYDVEISKKGIKVGCQDITPQKFKEIISLAKEVGLIS